MATVHIRPAVEHADDSDFPDKVLASEVPVLVDFYADWCAPCRMLAPVLEELAGETPDVKVVKVNVDESPELAAEYGVQAIPTLVAFKDGRIVGHHTGLANKAYLKSLLAR